MRKVQVLFSLAIVALLANFASAQLTLTYDPADGNLSMASDPRPVTSFELVSAGSKFIPGNVNGGIFTGLFDVASASKMFKLDPAGYSNLDFGKVLPASLSEADLAADLTLNGSFVPDGSGLNGFDAPTGGGVVWNVVPEPSSIGLVLFGLVGMLRFRRK